MKKKVDKKRPSRKRSVEAPALLSPKHQGVFNADDGTPIYYEVHGKGSPLLFCYGLVCRREHWRHQLARFAKTHRVVMFDYRGHQASGRPRNDHNLTVEWVAKDIVKLLDHLEIEKTVGFGHSLGVPCLVKALSDKRFVGSVLICGAVTNPFLHMFYTDRIQKLYQAVATTHIYAPRTTEFLWSKFTKVGKFNYLLTRYLGFNSENATDQDIISYLEGVAQTPFSVFNAFLKDYTQFDGRKLLPKIKSPVLVLAGEDDLITPVYLMEEMAKELPHAELVRVPNASHNAHNDFPMEINDLISHFLGRIGFK